MFIEKPNLNAHLVIFIGNLDLSCFMCKSIHVFFPLLVCACVKLLDE